MSNDSKKEEEEEEENLLLFRWKFTIRKITRGIIIFYFISLIKT